MPDPKALRSHKRDRSCRSICFVTFHVFNQRVKVRFRQRPNPNVSAQNELSSIFDECNSFLEKGDESEALDLLKTISIDSIMLTLKEQKKCLFLTMADFALVFPGVNSEFASKLRREFPKNCIEIPGFGDVITHPVHKKWDQEAGRLAKEFNQRMFYELEIRGEVKSLISLNECPDLLDMDPKEWKSLTLNAQLHFRQLIEIIAMQDTGGEKSGSSSRTITNSPNSDAPDERQP